MWLRAFKAVLQTHKSLIPERSDVFKMQQEIRRNLDLNFSLRQKAKVKI